MVDSVAAMKVPIQNYFDSVVDQCPLKEDEFEELIDLSRLMEILKATFDTLQDSNYGIASIVLVSVHALMVAFSDSLVNTLLNPEFLVDDLQLRWFDSLDAEFRKKYVKAAILDPRASMNIEGILKDERWGLDQ